MSDENEITKFDSSFAAQLDRVAQLTGHLSEMAEFENTPERLEFIRTMARLSAEQLLAYIAGDRAAYDRIQAEGSEVTKAQLEKSFAKLTTSLTE